VSFKFDPPDTRDYTPQGANAGGEQQNCFSVAFPLVGCCHIWGNNFLKSLATGLTVPVSPLPHWLPPAGKQHVYDNGRLQWPNGRFGLCGEPWDKPVKRYEAPGRITGTCHWALGHQRMPAVPGQRGGWGRVNHAKSFRQCQAAVLCHLQTVLHTAFEKHTRD